MLTQDFTHKNWLDDQNSQAAIENYYDQLPEQTKRGCDLKAKLTLIGVKIATAKEIYQKELKSYHTLDGVPF